MGARRLHLIGASLVGSGIAIAFLVRVPHDPLAQRLAYDLVSIGLVGVFAIGLGRNLTRHSWVWRALFAGVVCELGGDIVSGTPAAASPTWLAHLLYLAEFPFFITALIATMKPRRLAGEGALAQLLDSAIIFVSGFAVLWYALLDKPFDAAGVSVADRVLMLAYPLLDWLVVALILRFLFAPGRWPLALKLVVCAMGLMFLSDLGWQGDFVRGTGAPPLWVGVTSLLGYLFWTLAGLDSSVAQVEGFSGELPARARLLHRRRLALLLVCACVPAALLIATYGFGGDGDSHDMVTLFLVVVAVPVLTVARLADLFRSLERSLDEAQDVRSDLEAVIDASPIPICVTDHEASVLLWNAAAEEVSGYRAEEVLGAPPPVLAAEDAERVAALYGASLAGAVHRGVEIKLLDRQQRPLDIRFSTAPLAAGRRGVVVLFEDVTEQKQNVEKIEFLANHDPLTGLPNRRSFELELDRAVGRSLRGAAATLLLCDVDDFKLVNDTAGHPVGDRFLIEIANRLRGQVRPGDAVSRLSGDEFAVLLADTDQHHSASAIERLLDAVRDYQLETESGLLEVTLSVGVYELREGETTERALRRADEALYEAKAHGKNQQRAWRADNVSLLGAARGWSPRIRDALRHDRIEPFLQPIVSLPTEKTVFYEALCRLRSEDGGYVAPAAFLDHAEQFGLISDIDRRMLEHAERLLREHDDLKIFINLSATSLDDEQLVADLAATLETLPAGSLGIEITEHAAITDLEHVRAQLGWFKKLGALIAIDDFGVGFTSFEQLRQLPADLIKVGAPFVGGLGVDPVNDAILDGIVATASALSMRVVAEGVETRETAALLRLRDISFAQGYLYGRPEPAESALRVLQPRLAAARLPALVSY